jgi:hypothetical protein
MITQNELKELLNYDSTTGVFTWKKKVTKNKMIGDRAGSTNKDGYETIMLEGKNYASHRLAWFFVHGVWPAECIDHINLDASDNRIANLREASRAENNRNTKAPSNSSTGIKGITWNKDCKKWAAKITVNKKQKHLGVFADIEEAKAVLAKVRAELHREFARNE